MPGHPVASSPSFVVDVDDGDAATLAAPISGHCPFCRPGCVGVRCKRRRAILGSSYDMYSTCPTFLRLGMCFAGSQAVSTMPFERIQSTEPQLDDRWDVLVMIEHVDFCRGVLSGTMEAVNVPAARSRVITCWEGEIIDGISSPESGSHSFWTRKWGATRAIDIQHWSKFKAFNDEFRSVLSPLSAPLNGESEQIMADPTVVKERVAKAKEELARKLVSSRFIFMRWKETKFVNVDDDCGLTIAGFYYLCFDRFDGHLCGFYQDPNSSPFQRLSLTPKLTANGGLEVPTYTLC